ncbi:MAG TPA: U32 family peptidase, partial [bacterium]|nr:U32 family peptidase [bacterium]
MQSMFAGEKRPQIVAPAGDPAALVAALRYGADAVYIGLKEFSARMHAENFAVPAFQSAVAYAHRLGKKAYLALNTLFKDDEVSRVIEASASADLCGVDGIIIQDIGLYGILRRYFPSVRIHASTQMACYTLDGARQLADMGFSRVVLARELSLEEIRTIREGTAVELEVFVHGALCYSMSGLCLLSSHIGGRSGNRGRCAQPCRRRYRAEDGRAGHYFSMNDLCAGGSARDLARIGIDALKIEGRMKGATYAGAVSAYYRDLLDGKEMEAERDRELKIIFSRESVRDYYGSRSRALTELDHPGNVGLFIGEVSGSACGRFTLTTAHALEVRDGLQLFYENRPIAAFSIAGMSVSGKKTFEAPAGVEVSIAHNGDVPSRARVYLVSSQRLNKAYAVPDPARELCPYRIPLDCRVAASAAGIDVDLSACGRGKRYHFDAPHAAAARKGLDEEMLRGYFSRLGGGAFELRSFSAAVEQGIFIPPTELNKARREAAAD